ncbi:MAG: iron-sulfur cluster assembly scaffold protein [Verrucomicrobiales bacterium]
MSEPNDVEARIQNAIANPQNMGEMADADSVGTVGNPECGDMVRLWLKFKEEDGRKVIDKASFQSFGCQTAIAVASMATELLKGKTVDEARALESNDLSKPLGSLPPMKMHCGEMVEGALRDALKGDEESPPAARASLNANTLLGDMAGPGSGSQGPKAGKIKVVKLD